MSAECEGYRQLPATLYLCAMATHEKPTCTDAVPAGCPPWITRELVAKTRKAWQPFYPAELTDTDALEILQNVSHLIGVLEVTHDETFSSSGQGFES